MSEPQLCISKSFFSASSYGKASVMQPPFPQLLAIETCFGKFSIALFVNGELKGHFANSEATKQAEELVPAIENLLREHNTSYKNLSAIAACVGPGSFTGLRIGLAAAKGLALALNIPLIGVSSLEATLYKKKSPVYLDAARGNAYFQKDVASEPEMIEYNGAFDEPAGAIEVGYVALSKREGSAEPLYIRPPDAKPPKNTLLANLHAQCFDQPWRPNDFEGLETIITDHGFVAYKSVIDECEIKTICILPEARRKGMGEKLIQELIQAANAKTIFLEVEHTNEPAKALYKKLGFEEFGKRADYYGKGRHALLMRLQLS